jgi:predicted aspartyl protease
MTLSNKNDFLIPTTIETNSGKRITMDALLDSGATSSFIDCNFAQRNGIPITYTDRPIQLYNTDGLPNNNGAITGYVEILLQIKQHVKQIQLGITSLGKLDTILGLSWMKTHNPSIDWEEGWVHFDQCPEEC